MAEKNTKEMGIVGYVMGILSIVFGVISPVAGLVFGILGIVNSKKHKTEFSKKAWVMSIIGLIISVVVFVLVIVASYVYNGSAASSLLAAKP